MAVDTRLFSFWPNRGQAQKEVIGSVSGRSFKLQRKGDRYDRNSFAPILVGRIEESAGGTTVTAKFRMLLFTLVFMALFPFYAAMFVVVGFGWEPVIMPLAIGVMPFVIYAATRKQAAEQRAYLRNFLLTTLEAKEVGPPAPLTWG